MPAKPPPTLPTLTTIARLRSIAASADVIDVESTPEMIAAVLTAAELGVRLAAHGDAGRGGRPLSWMLEQVRREMGEAGR